MLSCGQVHITACPPLSTSATISVGRWRGTRRMGRSRSRSRDRKDKKDKKDKKERRDRSRDRDHHDGHRVGLGKAACTSFAVAIIACYQADSMARMNANMGASLPSRIIVGARIGTVIAARISGRYVSSHGIPRRISLHAVCGSGQLASICCRIAANHPLSNSCAQSSPCSGCCRWRALQDNRDRDAARDR